MIIAILLIFGILEIVNLDDMIMIINIIKAIIFIIIIIIITIIIITKPISKSYKKNGVIFVTKKIIVLVNI